MPFQLSIPRAKALPLPISLNKGEVLFVLGANGTGKSSLMHRLYKSHAQNAHRISAHRQTWFQSSSINMPGPRKDQTEQMMRNSDLQEASRWKDAQGSARTTLAIFRLVDAENSRARAITSAVDAKDALKIAELSAKEGPFTIINRLLKLSNLPIEISARENDQVVASKSKGPQYGIDQLSDGERNALLIAADILTAKPDTLLIIDEPERHLHRSIISPLLTQLFKERSDCAFIISTHDVSLPLDNPKARTLLVRGCVYNGSNIVSWDADLLPADANIDETLKRDIIGARSKVLFVEGTARSLDQPLYALLFPEASVVYKHSCRDVEHAVDGLRAASELHWLHAFGIVDNDSRSPDDIAQLKARGVYALPVFSVESLYYHPEIQRRIAERQSSVTGGDPKSNLAKAQKEALAVLGIHAQRLSERVAEKAVREEVMRQLPRRKDIQRAQVMNIQIDIPAHVAKEISQFNPCLASGDLATLLQRYPVRETPVLDRIAEALDQEICRCSYLTC